MSVMARSVHDLTAYASENRVKYLFFWGHQPERDGSVGAGCLSQWWPSSFEADGEEFASAEHYMMWRKAVLFDDDAMAGRILSAPHPKVAKTLGGRVSGFRQEVWDAHRYEIVVSGNRAKFGQHDALRDFLLTSGDRVLVEASPLDRIWGIGLSRDDPAAADPRRWRGTNLLGFALMDVRESLVTVGHGQAGDRLGAVELQQAEQHG
ncbi:NADAR family protein [Actinoplanes bogorensis]|uniref:NADAR family protein n=1 Tax=Paractinoplanes bogorensis TaxID=1610840 RepID=A0ABS5YNS0_9ACTN|nr:NADAR family protein [Actinoplanes bogorensis]MBU2665111.1 NADAR family protein [Actinoplanes bogorensis]